MLAEISQITQSSSQISTDGETEGDGLAPATQALPLGNVAETVRGRPHKGIVQDHRKCCLDAALANLQPQSEEVTPFSILFKFF